MNLMGSVNGRVKRQLVYYHANKKIFRTKFHGNFEAPHHGMIRLLPAGAPINPFLEPFRTLRVQSNAR